MSYREINEEKYPEDHDPPISRKEVNKFDFPDENGVHPSLYELQRRVLAERTRAEAEEEDKIYHDLVLAEEERERATAYAQETEYDDYDYDPWADYVPRCPDCGAEESDIYYVSKNYGVCECSPLYPDLRPGDLPRRSPCSCNIIRYGFLGESVCRCSSPDLYALLERQYVLEHGHLPVLPSDFTSGDVPF